MGESTAPTWRGCSSATCASPRNGSATCAPGGSTRIGEEYLRRLIDKYGVDTVVAAMAECQNYVERLTRARIKELPKGTWETDDFLDIDPDKGKGWSASTSS